MDWDRYYLARDIKDALDILQNENGDARVIAGGTDLVLQQRRGERRSRVLVDISHIRGLDQIISEDNVIVFGAIVTHAQAASSRVVLEHIPALAQACAQVGSPQIRNMGTLVGNIVSAQPGADAALSMHAFETSVVVVGPMGERTMELPDLYAGLGICCVDSARELITHIKIRLPHQPQHSAFERLSQRHTLTLPVINTAVAVRMDQANEAIDSARITIGPVSPKPFRAKTAEEALRGAMPSGDLLGKAAQAAASESKPRDSLLRGSHEYRKAMVAVLVRRALERAVYGR